MTARQRDSAIARYRIDDDVDLALWEVRELRPGQSTVYHRGFLLADRRRAIVARLADEVYRRARAGEIYLTQRRLNGAGAGPFAYIATKRRVA